MNNPPRKQAEKGMFAPVWREFNRMIDFMREIQVSHGRNVRVNRTMNGTMLLGESKQETAKPSPPVKRYRVKSVGDDTIVANEILSGGGVSATDTTIAKPFNLRSTGWNGQSVNYAPPGYPGNPGLVTVGYSYQEANYRIATITTELGTTTEHQVITPYYLPGISQIMAAEPENGTGVEDTTLVDMNSDGRAWARAV